MKYYLLYENATTPRGIWAFQRSPLSLLTFPSSSWTNTWFTSNPLYQFHHITSTFLTSLSHGNIRLVLGGIYVLCTNIRSHIRIRA